MKNRTSFIKDVRADAQACGKSGGILSCFYLFFMNSGFLALFLYRVYAPLWRKEHILRALGKIIERFSQILTGCYLSPEAEIDGGVYFPHGVGIVIGSGVVVHSDVTIYQHVTLGRKEKSLWSAPTLLSGVTVYAQAVVVGNIVVPENLTIPALSLVKDKSFFEQ